MRATYFMSVFALLVSLAGCATNPSTGRSQLDLVSSEDLAQMGEQATPELIAQHGGEVNSADLRKYVNQVGKRLTRHVEPEYHDIKWEFHTLDSEVINAFALPPGNVFITTGLLSKLKNEAEVAAVLSHEIGHITAAHVDERMSQQMLAQLGLGVLGQSSESQIVNAGAQLLTQGTLLKFSRDQESEADSQGLKYMTKAGYDPRGMVGVLEVLEAADQGGGAPEFFSTHPDPARRLKSAQREISEDYSSSGGKLHEERFRDDAKPHLSER